jgi:translation initiation factor 3 subunit F
MGSDSASPATYGSSPALLLDSSTGGASSDAVSSVTVHPLVLLSVLDHHTRRAEGAGRVIGTLLGRRDGSSVEITNCFAVPHAERGDEVAIGKDFNRQMLALHSRADRREVVVGWYGTALPNEDGSGHSSIADTSSLIHEFYAGECDEDPIHLVVDTGLDDDAINLRAYVSSPVVVAGEALANLFHEVRLSLKSSEAERICVDDMIKSQQKEGPDADAAAGAGGGGDATAALKVSMTKLLDMLESASQYVDSVVEGRTPPDDAVGRQIADTLSAVPRVRPEVFDKTFADTLQDMLMVTYLTNVTKTQLTIAEKLNETLGV